jgi:DNA-binding CsgD family transcriptional regulator
LRRVFAKLGVGSRAAMVASLIKKGNLKNAG